jgi:hypothetical protein
MVSFSEAFGINALDSSIEKFRSLRDEYREANRNYFGDYLFAMLDEK